MASENGSLTNTKYRDLINQFRKSIETFTTQSHTDEYLLRFLKAKNYNLRKAEIFFRNNLNIRQFYELDTIAKTYQKKEVVEKCEFAAFLGFDKEGSPIQYCCIGGGDFNGFLLTGSTFEICSYCAYCVEKLLELQREYNEKTGKYCEPNISAIFDLRNFCLTQITYQHVIQTGLDTMRMYQEIWPGFLNRLIIINAPAYFSIAFNIFKPILKMDLIQRMIVCNEDSSPSVLLKYIDADVLPEFLGGKRVDENGDPKCSSFLKFGCKIPEKDYRINRPHFSLSDPGALEMNIPARAIQDISKDVDQPGSKLQLEFWSNSAIGLSILYRSKNKSRNGFISGSHCTTDELSNEELVSPYSKVQSHLASVDTYLHCSRAGTYIFRFDNTFSWMSSKRLVYRIQVLPPTA